MLLGNRYESYSLRAMHKRDPILWKRRSTLERSLTVVALTRVLLFIALTLGTADALGDQELTENVQNRSGRFCTEDVCNSAECVHIASSVLKNIDPDVEPCDNFYRFACGGFLKSTMIPDDKKYISTSSSMKDDLQKQLRAIMEGLSNPNELKPFRLVKKLYNSCVSTTAIEDQGFEPLLKILKKLGGWPVLDDKMWNEANFDWINSIYKFRDVGYSVDYFFRFEVLVDPENKTRRVITLDTADLALPDEYLIEGLDNKKVEAYYSYMVDIAVLLGAERELASTELTESLNFEIKLAEISQTIVERINSTLAYNLMTLDKLKDKYPTIPWEQYFRKLLPKEISVKEKELVIVNMPSFFSDLEKLISETPKRVQANYLLWRAVKSSVTYLNDRLRDREFMYSTALGDKTKREARWKECVDLVSRTLSIGVDAMYVRKYFNTESKQNVVNIVMEMRKQLYKTVAKVKWMDENMRQSALKKAAALFSYVGYPDELLDDTKLEKYYENLKLSGENYLENILSATLFNVEHSFGQLHKPVNQSDSVSYTRPTHVAAYYSMDGNSIHFPAGILQGPFFSSGRPKYMNYGGIGFAIGHEIAHGFSYIEKQFKMKGGLTDWALNKTKWLNMVECLTYQYGNYTVEEVGLKLNGIKTRKDNFADNAGIKNAYLAYNAWAKRNDAEKQLPGLPYSPNQMFWISAANPWCTKYRQEELKHRIKYGHHSPDEFRIIGSLSNMPEFSYDFNCPIGSKMNPRSKCTVW